MAGEMDRNAWNNPRGRTSNSPSRNLFVSHLMDSFKKEIYVFLDDFLIIIQSRLSEELLVEVEESRTSKSLLQEKEKVITNRQNELIQARDESSQMKESLEEKTKVLELIMSEYQDVKTQLEEMIFKVKNVEAENKMLIDRWMWQKMQNAKRLNEITFCNILVPSEA